MPLSNVPRLVSGFLQSCGDRALVESESVTVARTYNPAYPPAPDEVRDIHPYRVTPRQQRRPGRRADRTHGVRVIQLHALGSHAVEVRCLVKRRARATQVTNAQVVDQDHNDIRLWTVTCHSPSSFSSRHHRYGASSTRITAKDKKQNGPRIPRRPYSTTIWIPSLLPEVSVQTTRCLPRSSGQKTGRSAPASQSSSPSTNQ